MSNYNCKIMYQPVTCPPVESLTQREVEVLQLISLGLSNKEIAESLVITHLTVKKHVSNIYGKLGAKRRTQAVVMAQTFQLL